MLELWNKLHFEEEKNGEYIPCIQNVNNKGTKYVRIMKQIAFWREKNGEYTPCI